MTRRARKRLFLVLAAGGALLVLAVSAHSLRQVRKERTIAAKLEEGLAAYQQRDYEAAINPLAFYVNRRDDNPEAAFALADSLRRVPAENDRHIPAAINVARRAAEAAPDKTAAHEMLLELYGLAGYTTERLETAGKLLAANPRHAAAMRARVESLSILGRNQEAHDAAVAMAAAVPENIDAHRLVIATMGLLGRSREAMRDYSAQVAAANPDSLRAAVLHAESLVRLGEIQAAIEIARASLSLRAESVAAVSEFLLVLDALGLDEDAGRLIQSEVASDRLGVDIHLLAGERAWKSGRPAEARRLIDPAVREGNEEAIGWAALLDADDAAGPATGEAAAKLASRNTSASRFWRDVVAAREAFTSGDAAAARERLRTALAARPESTLAEFLLGRVHESVGDWPAAVASWERVVARDPGYRVARLSLVTTLLRNGRIDDARRHAVLALSARSGLAEVYSVSRAFVAAIEAGRAPAGDLERVVGVLESLRGRPGTDPVLLPLLARVYLSSGRQADGLAIVRTIIADGPIPPTEEAVALAGAVRRVAPDLADGLLAAARRANPADSDLVFVSALAAATAGRPEEGREALEAAVAAADGPAKIDARIQLAIFLDRINDPRAREAFVRLSDDAPANTRVQIALLESQAAWESAQAVAAAIGRLRAVSGEASSVWKQYEARRILVFDRTPQNAARVVQLLADLLRADPDNAVGMTLMADAMLLLDDRDKAIDFLGRVADSSRNAALFPPLIALLSEAGRTEDIQRRLREFLRVSPITTELRRTRAELLAAHGLLAEAQREFEALAADGHPTDLLNLARIHVRRGDNARAKSILERLMAAPEPGLQAVLAAAELEGLQGNVDRGASILEERLPRSTPAHERAIHLGGYLDRFGRIQQAEAAFVAAAATGTPEAAASLISFYIARSRHAEAQSAINAALDSHPDDARLLGLQNLIRIARGDAVPTGSMADVAAMAVAEGDDRTRQQFLEAMRAWEANPSDRAMHVTRLRRITDASPTFYPAWFFLISALLEENKVAEAAQFARVAARVMPSDPRAARLAVAALTRAGQHPEALEMARQWRGRLVGPALDADLAIAELSVLLNRPADAVAALEPWKARLAADAEQYPARVEFYAAALAAARRAQEAHAFLWPLAESQPGLAAAYIRVAEQIAGNPAERVRWLERVTPLIVDQPGGRFMLGHAWYTAAIEDGDSSHLERVVEHLGEAPEIHPDPARASLLLAAAHEALGNPQAALRFYRIAIQHASDDPVILNNFAYLLVNSGGSAEEALTHARRAVELSSRGTYPPNFRASFLDTLGVTLLRLERYEDAERTFREAANLNPRDLGILVNTAEAQVRRGDVAAATETVRRVDGMARTGTPLDQKVSSRIQTVRNLIQNANQTPR